MEFWSVGRASSLALEIARITKLPVTHPENSVESPQDVKQRLRNAHLALEAERQEAAGALRQLEAEARGALHKRNLIRRRALRHHVTKFELNVMYAIIIKVNYYY